MGGLVKSKSKLRAEMRRLLRDVSGDSVSKASEKICDHITHSDIFNQIATPLTIAVYAAHGPEPSLRRLHYLKPEVRLVYPLCQNESRLTFHHVTEPQTLAPGMLAIPEPNPALHEEVALANIDIILCPGLAFGKDGSRLGHGGGYYDRALELFQGIVCGIALDAQVRDTVPHALHDMMMHYVISETGITATKPH